MCGPILNERCIESLNMCDLYNLYDLYEVRSPVCAPVTQRSLHEANTAVIYFTKEYIKSKLLFVIYDGWQSYKS